MTASGPCIGNSQFAVTQVLHSRFWIPTSYVSQLKKGNGSTSSETFHETSPLSSRINSVLKTTK